MRTAKNGTRGQKRREAKQVGEEGGNRLGAVVGPRNSTTPARG